MYLKKTKKNTKKHFFKNVLFFVENGFSNKQKNIDPYMPNAKIKFENDTKFGNLDVSKLNSAQTYQLGRVLYAFW